MPTYPTPRSAADAVEDRGLQPAGRGEHFTGYGLVGLPFESGHILGFRRFPASSVGPGFTSIWHRSPRGRWSFSSTAAPAVSCARYTGEISDDSREMPIEHEWIEPFRLRVACDHPAIEWEITFRSTLTTRALTAAAQRLKDQFGAHDAVLRGAGSAAGLLLRAGRLRLVGTMPNGQGYRLVPSQVWEVASSWASLEGADLGRPARLPQQEAIGDFLIPQRGLLAVGELTLDALDPVLHSTRTCRRSPARRDVPNPTTCPP